MIVTIMGQIDKTVLSKIKSLYMTILNALCCQAAEFI
jgi:hypothetical protein